MSEIEDGGPAFPGPDQTEKRKNIHEGMTLRDYFAAKAMQGMMTRDGFDPGQATPEQRATLAYIEADAMLKAR